MIHYSRLVTLVVSMVSHEITGDLQQKVLDTKTISELWDRLPHTDYSVMQLGLETLGIAVQYCEMFASVKKIMHTCWQVNLPHKYSIP